MQKKAIAYVALPLAALLLAGCEGDDGAPGAAGPAGPAGAQGPAGAAGADATQTSISLTFLARARNPASGFDESAAEIVSFDPATSRLFVVNAESGDIDVFDLTDPAAPVFDSTLDVDTDVAAARADVAAPGDLGAANSVDVDTANGVLAVAIEADPSQEPGYVAFYQTDGTFLSAVQVGALPDMLTFTPDASAVVVANEGEPSGDYQTDPEGSVSIIDVSGGAAMLMDANVATADFTAFNGAVPDGVRVFGPGATAAQDFEPEYVAVSADSTTAYVALQENNAVAVVDITTATVTDVIALGVKDHRLPGNELDAADDDGAINIRNWPIFGMYLPDAIAAYEVAGSTYIVTANEGDAREYFDETVPDQATCDAQGGFDFDAGDGCLVFIDEFDIEDLLATGATINLSQADIGGFLFDADGDGDVDADDLATDASLGRYAVTTTTATGCDITDGADIGNCTFDRLHGYGARSFSIFDATTRQLVFDSGSDFERITAQRLGEDFNSDNDENGSGDSRSDAKGPEPEAVALGVIGGKTYAFIGLERVGGIMVYDVTVPEQSSFVQYVNPRDFSVADVENPLGVVDLGPESIEFVPAADSPSGEALILVGNEVSGTINVFQVNVLNTGS
ncbi:MAG: choice-of-anchor I family protein [Pseudomonadales bacterium]|nr:choice-of-anchor I family protein [Pseudomonadales bacterium]